MYQAVIKVQPLADYQLALTFKNGEEGIFDIGHILNWKFLSRYKTKPLSTP